MRQNRHFSSIGIGLPCQFGLPVSIIPEHMAIFILSLIASDQTPFNECPQNPGEATLCSNPICMGGYLQADGHSYLLHRQGIFLAAGKDRQDCLVVYVVPPNPCRSRQYSRIRMALEECGDLIPAIIISQPIHHLENIHLLITSKK
jgi:hypothetical protein